MFECPLCCFECVKQRQDATGAGRTSLGVSQPMQQDIPKTDIHSQISGKITWGTKRPVSDVSGLELLQPLSSEDVHFIIYFIM